MTGRTVIRKSAKWGGMVVAVILAMMWIGSYWWHAVYLSRVSVCFGDGNLLVTQLGFDLPKGDRNWSLRGPGTGRDRVAQGSLPTPWLPLWKMHSFGNWVVDIPLWIPVALTAAIAGAGWWADSRARRAAIGACATCGYSLAGLTAGARCPECGGKPGAA